MRSLFVMCDIVKQLFSRSRLVSTQLVASEELVKLAIEDPVIRSILADFRLNNLAPKFEEPDVLLTTTKAFSFIKDTETHSLWT